MSRTNARSSIVVLVATAVTPRGAFAQAGATSVTCTSTLKSSSVRAIAGGVVGGLIVGIAIAGIVAWLFVRRRLPTKAGALSAAFNDSSVGPGCTPSIYMTRELRLYDPSDPSTFPTPPPSGATPATIDNVYQKPSIPPHVYSHSTGTGQYSGAPEL
ncbi:hypothetical protein AZE42_10338 [Rhizopogon vesiculosus]|uniref:Mid2 domain-containing protein n=1 Tax=Rhizopogon vesiculosus TaxID=180088 RepID=A0A1J8R1Y6_9AGAM|nr:hypothetical protein AZE42_10338 [Rhizopogon vesiculosus]